MVRKLTGTALAALLLSAVAFAFGGCGGSDDGGADAAGSEPPSAEVALERAMQNGTAKEQVEATYRVLVARLYARDTAGACALMTKAVQAELSANFKTCAARLKSMFANHTLSNERPYIVTLKVDGDRARGQAKTKSSNRYPVAFAKSGDRWLVSGGVFGTRNGG